MNYRPTFQSFLASTAVSLSPAATAGVVVFLQWPATGRILLALSAVMGLFSAVLLLQDILVHLTRVRVDDRGMSVEGPLTRVHLSWSDVRHAVLRERRNALTRTDHLLIIEGVGRSVTYPTSVLPELHEAQLLEAVRRHVPLVTRLDRAAL